MSDEDQIRDAVHNMFEDALRRMEPIVPEKPFISDPNKLLTVRKMVAYWPMSDEQIHPERYPAQKTPWRYKMRWWRLDYQDRFRLAWDAIRGRHDCGEGY